MTKRAGVIGHPITHSLSPKIHNYWLKQYEIEGSYEAVDVSPQQLPEFIKTLSARGFVGVNVTIPHKQEVMKYLDNIHVEAAAIGAVNTIIIEQGKTYGHNTDAQGFITNIQEEMPDLDLFEQKAVMFGAGGAARAVAVALIEEGAKLFITNRTKEKATTLKQHLVKELAENYPEIKQDDAITIVDWEKRNEILSGAAILANTTSLGMKNYPALNIDLDHLPEDAVVTDIVYSPLKTDLLKKAEERGNKTVDGLGMLLYQAEPGFYAWFGQRPEVTKELRAAITGELNI